MLTAADVHVAERLCALTREENQAAKLALALAVRAVRTGSVALDLGEAIELRSEVDGASGPEAPGVSAGPEVPGPDAPGLPPPNHSDPDLIAPPTPNPHVLVFPDDPVAWLATVAASRLAQAEILRVEFGLVYLDRYWEQEREVAQILTERLAAPPPPADPVGVEAALERLFPDPRDVEQRRAAELAALGRTTIITGGPGTGKTTTVAKILAVLAEQALRADGFAAPRFALVAPTAKAANRLGEAFAEAAAGLPEPDRERLPALTASTVHRLLGWNPHSRSRFRHHRDNRLALDAIVLDEASMVSLTLMARLLEALRPGTRLIVVGDPDQLASVEAGAVLADLVAGLDTAPPASPAARRAFAPRTAHPAPTPSDPGPASPGPELAPPSPEAASPAPDLALPGPEPASPAPDPAEEDRDTGPRRTRPVARLTRIYRYGNAIGELAAAVRAGAADRALELLGAGHPEVALTGDPLERRALMVQAALDLRSYALADDAPAALACLRRHRLLCAHRSGPYGVAHWNRQVEQWLAETTGDTHWAAHYPGRPLLVTANDYGMDLFNGDTGVIVARPDPNGRRDRLVAAFDAGSAPKEVAAARLSDIETMFAATVHKSQGSQADEVTVILPDLDSPLLTRELIYTAVTRARRQVTLVGTEEAVHAGLARRITRASGLRHRLAGAADR